MYTYVCISVLYTNANSGWPGNRNQKEKMLIKWKKHIYGLSSAIYHN